MTHYHHPPRGRLNFLSVYRQYFQKFRNKHLPFPFSILMHFPQVLLNFATPVRNRFLLNELNGPNIQMIGGLFQFNFGCKKMPSTHGDAGRCTFHTRKTEIKKFLFDCIFLMHVEFNFSCNLLFTFLLLFLGNV
jgi:hypothetical protein